MSRQPIRLPSGKRANITMENPHFFKGKSTISMAMFNSFLCVYHSYGPLPVISTKKTPIYRMYNPIEITSYN